MKNRPSIHQALKLPSGYRIHVAVDGYVENVHYSLRMLRTDTHGQMAVHAISPSWGAWQETDGVEFMRVAKLILGLV